MACFLLVMPPTTSVQMSVWTAFVQSEKYILNWSKTWSLMSLLAFVCFIPKYIFLRYTSTYCLLFKKPYFLWILRRVEYVNKYICIKWTFSFEILQSEFVSLLWPLKTCAFFHNSKMRVACQRWQFQRKCSCLEIGSLVLTDLWLMCFERPLSVKPLECMIIPKHWSYSITQRHVGFNTFDIILAFQ